MYNTPDTLYARLPDLRPRPPTSLLRAGPRRYPKATPNLTHRLCAHP